MQFALGIITFDPHVLTFCYYNNKYNNRWMNFIINFMKHYALPQRLQASLKELMSMVYCRGLSKYLSNADYDLKKQVIYGNVRSEALHYLFISSIQGLLSS